MTDSAARIRQILQEERDLIMEVLGSSRKMVNQSGRFRLEQLEGLLEHRSTQIDSIDRLERERIHLGWVGPGGDEDLEACQAEITQALDAIVAIDCKIRELTFQIQIQTINSMAFATNVVNLRQNREQPGRPGQRLVNVRG